MSKRLGVIGIVIETPGQNAEKVNVLLSEYSEIIIGRMGIPRPEEHVGVIALIIEGSTDQVGALTGKLGKVPGVTVKSALTARTATTKESY
ncbi:MAG TPA: TM1266 family iron-only hydrogenase system putative regulator [Patescibacteria group bacterium]|nr:TM1266 family iron-only hydrogenase system putative regulator [Patescibacteria group bacterium]